MLYIYDKRYIIVQIHIYLLYTNNSILIILLFI